MSVSFIISLPRSGSTLLQRLLSLHQDVETSAEPWLLLPLLGFMSEKVENQTNYGFNTANEAFSDFLTKERKERYQRMLFENLEDVYFAGYQKNKVFIDKTPRYHLIIEEILAIFKESKIILLTRDPCSVINSILGTWGNGGKRWRLRPYYVDLFDGLTSICDVIDKKEQYEGRIKIVSYENLIDSTVPTTKSILSFLQLDDSKYDFSKLEKINEVKIDGQMGDQLGVKYTSIVKQPLTKKYSNINNWYRVYWVKKYIDWIGNGRLSKLGFDKTELKSEIKCRNGLNNFKILMDFIEVSFQTLKVYIQLRRAKNFSYNLRKKGELH